MEWLVDYARGFRHVFFPRFCALCNKGLVTGEDMLCFACETTLFGDLVTPADQHPALTRLQGRFPVDAAAALLQFAENRPTQQIIHKLKYGGQTDLGVWLGRRMAADLRTWPIDLIIPVPLHAKKQAARGYNQSDYIAQGLADIMRVRYLPKALKRIRHTESQTKKNATERQKNVANAFIVPNPKQIMNKHVLLVDDVLTTGATVQACAEALLAVPGVRVSVATAAIVT